MNADASKLLEIRKGQLNSLKQVIDNLVQDNNKLSSVNKSLKSEKEKLCSEEETLDIRLKSILKEK